MNKRKFRDRLKEHIAGIRYGQLTTALAHLHSTHDTQIDFSNARLIYPCNNFLKATIGELIEITNRKKDTCDCRNRNEIDFLNYLECFIDTFTPLILQNFYIFFEDLY